MQLVEIKNNQVVVSSRQVAERFGKRHSEVLRSIAIHIEDLKATDAKVRWFMEDSYKDNKGEMRKQYLMNRDGFSLLVMSFNNTRDVLQWKLKYIQAFNEMEKQLQSKAPTTLKEALILALQQQERIEQLEQQRELDKPKVEFYDDVTESTDTIDMKTVAKILNIKGIGRNKLFEILRNKKVLMWNNQPYQKYIYAGWFRQVETKITLPDGTIKINIKTVVFQKGLDGIRKLLKRG